MLQRKVETMDQIGRYEILEELGYGGMATVYKAHDPQISRTLAIKVLRQERCKDEEYRRRFLREAKAVGILSHPNIVTIYDISEIGNTPYIAMELLDGISLDKLMKSDYQPSMAEILDWSIQLAGALEYAHQRGIIHRDIKPSNIVLSKDRKTLKITDFGIAHFDETDVTQHTQLGEVLGTPQYMSPEQVLGKQADARSDLFSVGVIMYQLLTGQKPFQADTLATLLFQIATENPDPIGQVAPDLPGSLKQTVDKLLKKKPEKRFQSGAELKHALLRIVSDVKQDDHAGQGGKNTSIRNKWLGWSVALLALICSISGFFLHQKQQELFVKQIAQQGNALSQFIAFESAEAVLSEDWASVELFVQHLAEKNVFSQLDIIDHKNYVRGSSRIDSIGKIYNKPNVVSSQKTGNAILNTLENGNNIEYEVVTPIVFQTTNIGSVYLRLDSSQLEGNVQQFMFYYLFIASILIISSVILIFVFYKQMRSPLLTVGKAMHEIGEGNNAYRIGLERKDEFGQLFQDFDNMAANIQSKDESASKK